MHWAGKLAAEYAVSCVIHLGDVNNHDATSSFDKDKPGNLLARSIKGDYEIEYKANDAWYDGLNGHTCRQIMLDGNHDIRPLVYAERHPEVADTIKDYEQKRGNLGWERVPFQQPITVSGVRYCHMFTRTPRGKSSAYSVRSGASSARAQLQANMVSCIAGHIPGFDYFELPTDTGLRQSIIAGSYYPHQQSYAGPQGGYHWNGLILIHMVKPGEFDFERISIKRLKQWYG